MSDPAERPVPLIPTGSPVLPAQAFTRAPLPRWTVPVVAVVVLVATIVVLVVLWRWIDSLALTDPEKRAGAQLDAVKVAASIAVGGGGLFALYLAARRQRTQELELEARHAELAQRDRVQAHAEQVAEINRAHAERVAAASERDAADRRVTELYAKSVEQFGSEKAPVRLGGLYALERLAQDNPNQRATVVDVLCAYLRMPYSEPADPPGDDEPALTRHTDRIQERQVRLTAQRILATHLRPGDDPDRPVDTFWSDIDLDLTGAVLVDFTLGGCRTRTARFTGTTFIGAALFPRATFTSYALFQRATFSGEAGFNKATFSDEARFDDVTFGGQAVFGTATFSGAVFTGATFTGDARFDGARFINNARAVGEARFNKTTFGGQAVFEGATFNNAVFDKTTFNGDALFPGTTFIRDGRFDEATFNQDTTFRRATFSGNVRFVNAIFGGIATFAETTYVGNVRLDEALAVHQPTGLSVWPAEWRLVEEHDVVERREGTWHRLRYAPTGTIAPPAEA